MSSPQADPLPDQLLAHLGVTFRLDLRLAGGTLGDLLAETIRSASRDPEPDWGTPGDREQVETAERGPLSFTYRPHLFPGMDEALRLGHEVQFSLLPTHLPDGSPLEVAAVLESYCHLSGDLFGWHQEPGGALTVWLLDVSGHGVRAGFAAVVMKLLLADAAPGRPLDAIVTELERRFLEARNPADAACLYATGIFLRVMPGAPVEYLSAGHVPMLVRRGDGTVEQVESTGLPIALVEGHPPVVRRLDLGPGDLALLATDGLTDAHGPGGEVFGLDRVAAVLASGPTDPAQAAHALYREVDAHHDLTRLDDDLTFMVVRRRGPKSDS